MGNSVSGDTDPLPLRQLTTGAVRADPAAAALPEAAVKAWRFHSDGSPWVVDQEPLRTAEQVELRRDSTYVVLLLRRADAPPSGTMGALRPVAAELREACTPRGLDFPFSLNCELHDPSGVPPREVLYTIYVWYGKAAAGLCKALALRWGLELEKSLVQDRLLAQRLLATGSPGAVASPHSPRKGGADDCGGSPHAGTLPHLLRLLAAPAGQGLGLSVSQVPTVVSQRSGPVRPAVPSLSAAAPAPRQSSPVRSPQAAAPLRPREGWIAPAEEPAADEKREREMRERKLAAARPLCSEVLPHLCVGGSTPARALETLLRAGITHIANAAADSAPCSFRSHFAYLPLRLSDSPQEDIMASFPLFADFVDTARSRGGRVYVHCQEGVSRSCTLSAAWVAWSQGLTSCDAALDHVRERREVSRPNMGFAIRLRSWCEGAAAPLRIYRLAVPAVAAVGDGSPPLCLAPCRPGRTEEPACLDPRTAYVCVAAAQRAVWTWRGSRCAAAVAAAAKQLAPLCARFGAPTGGWTPEVSAVTEAREGAEPAALAEALRQAGCTAAPQPFSGYDAGCAALAEMAAEWDDWRGRHLADLSDEEEQRRAALRERDLVTLCSGKALVKAELEERLERQYIETADGWEAIADYDGLDDDSFEDFKEDRACDIVVFFKYHAGADRRELTVWMGEDCGIQAADAEEHARQKYEHFRQWAEDNEPWGRRVEWARVNFDWVLWQDEDGADEERFTARWILS